MKLNVPEMSCGHCTSAIEKAVKAADSGASVNCDLETHTVAIQSSLAADAIAQILKDTGYESTPA